MDMEALVMRLEEENRKLWKEVEHLKEENAALREENRRLKEELQKLRLKLFGLKPSKKKEEKDPGSPSNKTRKRGPPFGHKGASRRRPERVDRTVVLRPGCCPDCGGEVIEIDESNPRERYSEDIVPVPLFVTRYIIKQGYCPTCKKVVYPEVPDAIGNRHFGIRFLLYITYLRFVVNLPYNKMAQLLNDTYQAGVSEGTLVDYIRLAAEIFGPEYERIKREMREMNCHYDDTGQRVEGGNRWLWVFINREAVLYHTSKNRGKKVVVEVLGEDYDGVTVQDFYPSYDGAPGVKQKDWAHLLRDARDLVEKRKPPPGAKEFHEGLQGIFHDAKEAEEELKTARERKKTYRRFVRRLKEFAGGDYEHDDVKKLAKRTLKYRHEMFTFILVPGVEPTNNAAERALRPCVVQRKISGCHRTEEGATNRDVIMSVMGTMNLQGKDFLSDGKEYVLNTLT
jgi:transposase